MNIEPSTMLQDIFTSPDWRASRSSISYPNWLYFRERDKTGAVAALKKANARGNDFALGESGLTYILKRLKESGIDDAYVVLGQIEANGSVTFIASEKAAVVYELLRNIPPINGEFGPYWWITQSFNVAGRVSDDVAVF